MAGKKHARARDRSWKGWILGLVVGCLAAGALYWSWSALVSDKGTEDDQGSAAPSASPSTGKAAEPPARDLRQAVNRCASDLSAAAKVLSAARVGVHHWDTHVRARTDALRGRISERRMNRIFDRTRLGGPRDQHRYRAARKGFDGQLRCDFRREIVGPDDKDLVADCVTRAKAADRALPAAKRAMGDWRVHLKRMAKFRHGGMSAHRAQHLWVKAWRTAPTNIAAFERTDTEFAQTSACKRVPR